MWGAKRERWSAFASRAEHGIVYKSAVQSLSKEGGKEKDPGPSVDLASRLNRQTLWILA